MAQARARVLTLWSCQLQLNLPRALIDRKQFSDGTHRLPLELRAVDVL